MKTVSAVSVGALLGAIASVVHSQETIEPVVVTATRTAQTADESLASVSVITRAQIEQRQPRDLTDLLRSEAGISVSRNGGYGQTTNLYIRGTESRHVLVLVDGVRASAATTGEFAWQNINPDQIERIEIVRGPRASLYGSDAIGGVIHIFTRRSDSYARVAVGSYDTQEASFGLGGGDKWRYYLGGGVMDSEGFPTQVGTTENHGYDNMHASFTLEGPLREDIGLAVKLSNSQGRTEHDIYTGDNDYVSRIASMSLQHKAAIWSQSLTLGHALDEYTTHSPTYPATISTKRDSVSWQHDINNTLGLTSLGIDYWRDHAEKDDSGLIDETIDNTGAFIEHQWSGENNDLQLGMRQDHHDRYGDHVTWNAAWGLRTSDTTRMFISYGTAFKAPTVNGLFWPYMSDDYYGFTFITQGNPDLEAEESDTLEVGFRHSTGPVDLGINVYHTFTRNMIDWATTQTGPTEYTTTPVNLNEASIYGMELTSTWQVDDAWQVGGALTLLDARNEETGQQLDRRPKKQLVLHSEYHAGNHRLRGELHNVGERLDNDGNTELSGYSLLNVSYIYRISRDMTMDLRLENIADQDYILAHGYAGAYTAPGRSAYLGFTYRPKR